MFAPLVFVMSLFAFAFLVIGERMGLETSLAAGALTLIPALALVALGLAGVSSRLERYLGVAGQGRAAACLWRGAVLLLAFAAFAGEGVALWAGFPLGFLLAHRVEGAAPSRPGGQITARLGFALVLLALGARLFAPLAGTLGDMTGLSAGTTRQVLLALAVLLVLPGGARGGQAGARYVLGLAVPLVIAPMLVHLALALAGRGDPLTLEVLSGLSRQMPEALSGLSFPASGVIAGAAAGFLARGGDALPTRAAGLGLAGALLLAGLVAGVAVFGQAYLSEVIGQRILNSGPGQWPGFLFEDGVRGWLVACGQPLPDASALSRACARGAGGVEITFQAALQMPALARALQLSVLFGTLWQVLPLLIGLVALAMLLHRAAGFLSEALLHGLINPTGLRSWRLAMARLMLITLAAGLAFWPLRVPEAALALGAGLGVLGSGYALLPRRAPVAEPAA